MDQKFPYNHRDISWLAFNKRVLQEAQDKSVPLFERIKFLAIYSNNLDEFFRVRVAHHRNLIRLGKKDKKKYHLNSEDTLKQITKMVNKQQEEFSHIFEEEIIPELAKHKIHLRRRLELNEKQTLFIESYFNDHLLPFVQPVLLVKKKIRPFLNNAALYLVVQMRPKDTLDTNKNKYAILKIPSDHLPRFLPLPSPPDSHDLIMLDDIVRHNIKNLFPGYNIIDTFSVKLTRDAELYIDDEFSGNLLEKIKKSLSKRNVGPPSRFVYDRKMSKQILKYIKEALNLEGADLLKEGRYHNNFDFFSFPHFGMEHLRNTPLPPMKSMTFEYSKSIMSRMEKDDVLLFFPFHSYQYVVDLFNEAADDPNVTHIKIVQYRVARRSKIMEALMRAVKKGKQVTVFVEVKARFDEEANLRWAERLEKAGVRVLYSFPGLKVHCKIALITRTDDNLETTHYAYMSTGHFHEGTAKIYSDFGLFTTHKGICMEIARIFNFLESVKLPPKTFGHLMVGQFNLRSGIYELIDKEIKNAKAGKKAKIFLKLNSIEDEEMIQKLYDASQAGVQVKMIVRGICALVPGIKGISENISVISIVDRFLEHARIYMFYNEGDEKIYLSSADFMKRNLTYRIETAFPILNKNIKKEVRNLMNIQLSDNVKARIVDKDLKNEYKKSPDGINVRSQIETYYYLKRKEEKVASKYDKD